MGADQQAKKREENEVRVPEEHLKSVAEAKTGPSGAGVLATTNALTNECAARTSQASTLISCVNCRARIGNCKPRTARRRRQGSGLFHRPSGNASPPLTKKAATRQSGNAVPTSVGEYMGEAVAKIIRKKSRHWRVFSRHWPTTIWTDDAAVRRLVR